MKNADNALINGPIDPIVFDTSTPGAVKFTHQGLSTTTNFDDGNRNFKRVFRTQLKARKYLAAMFAVVADPFPEDQRQKHPALSLGTIKKIKTMRQQGFKVVAIAKELNVSPETVRRYAREGKNEQVVSITSQEERDQEG